MQVNGGHLATSDQRDAVKFSRIASPYIEGHRGRTFVVQIPGELAADRPKLVSLLNDVVLLHGMGVRLVLVLGCNHEIDARLQRAGRQPRYVKGYRVTDSHTLQAAMEAVSTALTEVSAVMSKAPAMSMVRRHSRSNQRLSYQPNVGVVCGNYISAKRRGVVGGVDFGATGKVRFVQVGALREQLDAGNVVLMGNLGYSASGELLNCNSYDVATHTAVELGADKLICMHVGTHVTDLQLPVWMPLMDAEALILRHYCEATSADPDFCELAGARFLGSASSALGPARDAVEFDLDDWRAAGFPTPVVAAVAACKYGVVRTHLVDASTDGSLLIELFSREGLGTMFSTDLYQGMRTATAADTDAIAELLGLLRRDGVPLPTGNSSSSNGNGSSSSGGNGSGGGGGGDELQQPGSEALRDALPDITVLEYEGRVAACAWLRELGPAPDGVPCGELSAFIVHPRYRGTGRGDSLLDYIEQRARERGVRRLALVTNKAVDWFQHRAWEASGPARESPLLPAQRSATIDPSGQLQLYTKTIFELDEATAAPAGKRIGY